MSDDQVAVPPPSPRTEERKHICEWLWSFESFTDKQHDLLEQGIVATLNAERAKAEAREAALLTRQEALESALRELIVAAGRGHDTTSPCRLCEVISRAAHATQQPVKP